MRIRLSIVLIILTVALIPSRVLSEEEGEIHIGIKLGQVGPLGDLGERFMNSLGYQIDFGYCVMKDLVFNVSVLYSNMKAKSPVEDTMNIFSIYMGPRYSFPIFESVFVPFVGAGAGLSLFRIRFKHEEELWNEGKNGKFISGEKDESHSFGLYPEIGVYLLLSNTVSVEVGCKYNYIFGNKIEDKSPLKDQSDYFKISSNYYNFFAGINWNF